MNYKTGESPKLGLLCFEDS